MKIEDHSVPLKLEDLLKVEAVDHPLQMDEVFPLLSLGLELAPLHNLMHRPHVLSKVALVDLFIEHCVLARKDCLHLLIHQLHFVLDPVMHALIEYFEYIELLPNVDLDILEVLLPLKQLPELQLLHFLLFHQLLEPRQQLQQLLYQ